MINRKERDLAKSLLERFLQCEITNDDFCDNYPRERNDQSIPAIYDRLWEYWDDRRTHTLSGKDKLTPDAIELFQRCIAFLGSDLEYEWPSLKWWSLTVGAWRLLGFSGIADKIARRRMKEISDAGNIEIWPFIRESDSTHTSPKASINSALQ